jgi:hypothetical protein
MNDYAFCALSDCFGNRPEDGTKKARLNTSRAFVYLERETRFELATLTLAT